MSELPAHLADGWHLLCQARDSSTISGPVETMGGGHQLTPSLAVQLTLFKSGRGGGKLCPLQYKLPPSRILRPSVGSLVLYVGSVH